MALITQSTISAAKTQTPVHVDSLRHRVFIWRGAWIEDPDLISDGDISIHSGREIGTANVTHHYSDEILRLRDADYRAYDPKVKDLIFKFVKITVEQTIDPGRIGQKVEQVPIFYGTIVTASDNRQSLMTRFACMDFKWLLMGIKNDRAFFEVPEFSPGATTIQGFLGKRLNDNEIFNEGIPGPNPGEVFRVAEIFEHGNRSSRLYDASQPLPTNLILGQTSDVDNGVRVFGYGGGSDNIWSHREIMDYFVKLFINRLANLPTDFPVEFRIAGADLLDSSLFPEDFQDFDLVQKDQPKQKFAEMDLRYKNMIEIVEEIVRSAGDLSWYLDVEESGANHIVTIQVWDRSNPSAAAFGVADAKSTISGNSIVGRIINPDPNDSRFVPSLGPVNFDQSARINRLIVLGARRRFMTTLAPFRLDQKNIASITRGWTLADETAMKADLDKAENEEARRDVLSKKQYDEVFRRFIVPEGFDWERVQELRSPGNIRAIFPRFSLTKQGGGLIETKNDVGIPFTGGANFSLRPRTFLPKLLTKVMFDYSTNPPTIETVIDGENSSGVGEFGKPWIWSFNVVAGTLVVDRGLTTLVPPLLRMRDFQMLEDTAGVKTSHSGWNVTDDGASSVIDLTGRSDLQNIAKFPRLWPYDKTGVSPDEKLDDAKVRDQNFEAHKTLAFTVALESDDRPLYFIEDEVSLAKGDPVRTLVIESDEFHYWEAREALVDDDPVIILGDINSEYVIRNDFEKLKRYANRIFRKLRGEKRDGVLLYEKLDLTWHPGVFVGTVRRAGPPHVMQEIQAPVMSVVHNVQDQTTVVKTQYDIAKDMELLA